LTTIGFIDLRHHPTSIRLPEDLKVFLDQERAKDSRSMAWLINYILRQWMDRKRAKDKDDAV